MLYAPLLARIAVDSDRPPAENPSKAMELFRNQAAWVLLGEPGAGKSSVFEKEAEVAGGEYLSVAEFICADDLEEWRGKTLFLDGLDEVRSGFGEGTVLYRIKTRLKQLGYPRFRIACRAADWFGSTDREELQGALSGGELTVLLLNPLNQQDILDILRYNHGVEDPGAFVEQAQRRGVADLLDNPQTLKLLAEAVRGDRFPATRMEIFQLACEKLAEEANKRHRIKKREHSESTKGLLDAAGQLCATLLLSGKGGVALDSEQADEVFPSLDSYVPNKRAVAYEVVGSKLFRPEGEERFVPSHRSIAEYLAAQWIAARVDGDGLPLGRVLNLLLGRDGRTIAGLRGLYGWLALHCQAARSRLLDADPLTVVLYGDAKPLPLADKRRILQGLKREAEHHTGFHWDVSPAHPFGALADPELTPDFIAILEVPERDRVSQAFVDCVLDILVEGEGIPGLARILRSVVVDDTRWDRIRQTALQTWLRLAPTPDEALFLLDTVTDRKAMGVGEGLVGSLLSHLYPEHIGPETLLDYLKVPKGGHLAWFWVSKIPEIVPISHLPTLLDQLVARTDLVLPNIHEFRFSQMVSALLSKGLRLQGDQATDEQLFSWLGIGADEYGDTHRDEADRQEIAAWLENHPGRYKALLLSCFDQCEAHDNSDYCIGIYKCRLHDATIPDDIGLWHLEQASLSASDQLAQAHLLAAVSALSYQRGSIGLSLEKIEVWADTNEKYHHWLQPLLVWEIPEWQTKQAERKRNRKQQRAIGRRERTIRVSEHIPAVRDGSASAELMYQLAGVWLNHFSDIPGNTLAERFTSYSENGEELLVVAEAGFIRCPERDDLPTVEEIITLAIKQREHYIRQPCLVGMVLRWRQGASEIEALSEEVLSCMVAFRLTYGADDTPDWFTYLVVERPALVAGVLVDYAGEALKSRREHVDSIYPLEGDPAYREVAVLAVLRLLERFPLRVKANLLHYLKNLLKSALRYRMVQLPLLAKKKIALKSMDVAQKVYWLAAAMLYDPVRHEADLWSYIGSSWVRANHLSGFLGEDLGGVNDQFALSAETIGRLIELLSPHAELDWSSGEGMDTGAMHRGDHVSALITRLGAMATENSAEEIERLLALPTLDKLKSRLENTRNQSRLKQREREFHFLPLADVAQILANRSPADVADLAALVLDHLDDIALEIRQENYDGFGDFWNTENRKPPGRREENRCRDALLRQLKARLHPFGIDCLSEADYFNDKRADIRLSYRNEFELPIELKRDDSRFLWSALRSQLINQYAIAPRASGYGIYCVLWFGEGSIPGAVDGGKMPRTPQELKSRLEAQLDVVEQRQIFIRVLDVSWPKSDKASK